jgi:hypothetical protein
MSLEMAHKVIVLQKKIMSRSFFNSSTFIVINNQVDQGAKTEGLEWEDYRGRDRIWRDLCIQLFHLSGLLVMTSSGIQQASPLLAAK